MKKNQITKRREVEWFGRFSDFDLADSTEFDGRLSGFLRKLVQS